MSKFRLSRSSKILAGVCGGLADYTDMDPFVVRFVWIVAIWMFPPIILLYIFLAIITPYEDDNTEREC